jgi:hypothetical protein
MLNSSCEKSIGREILKKWRNPGPIVCPRSEARRYGQALTSANKCNRIFDEVPSPVKS